MTGKKKNSYFSDPEVASEMAKKGWKDKPDRKMGSNTIEGRLRQSYSAKNLARDSHGFTLPAEVQAKHRAMLPADPETAMLMNQERIESIRRRYMNKTPSQVLMELIYETKAMVEKYSEEKGGKLDYNILQGQKVLGTMIKDLSKVVKEDKLDNENEVVAEIEKIKKETGLKMLEQKMKK